MNSDLDSEIATSEKRNNFHWLIKDIVQVQLVFKSRRTDGLMISYCIATLVTLIYTSAWARGSVVFPNTFQFTVILFILNET